MMRPGLGCKLPVLARAATGLALGTLLVADAGCGGQRTAYQGPTLRVSGDWNAWSTSESAPVLTWDGERYSGVVALPGDQLSLRLFSPATGQLVGRAVGTGSAAAVPSTVATNLAKTVEPFKISTPLPTRYRLDFMPATGQLHIDLADDAEAGLGPDAAALVTALRGADQLSMTELAQRADRLRSALYTLAVETPLHVGKDETSGLTFLHLKGVDFPELSVVGDFNSWTAGHDTMQVVLDGTVAYLGRRATGVRIEYRFDLHGLRYTDPLNLEVAWDGANLPPNPENLLGGGQGDWNSVGFAPGYQESAPRLRRLPQPVPFEGAVPPEVFVGLPAGYAQSPDRRYPTMYIYDGKDALVRGHYDAALQRLTAAKQIPAVIGVFVSSPTTPAARLAIYSSFPDTQYPEIRPVGDTTTKLLLDGVVPRIDQTYRTTTPRALLGIDMAGPYSFLLAWNDDKHRFTRVASQSGRFGWGDAKLVSSPYIRALGSDRSGVMERLSLDYCDGDSAQAQATVHDAVKAALSQGGYLGKVQITRQGAATGALWDGLRSRLDASLIFLLHDLVK